MIHYLYWLHLSEHTDILTQGYIGVSNNPNERYSRHKNNKENPHLRNAFIKYPEIKQTILLQGEEDYCYEIEEKLHFIPEIGWNINKGGIKPPVLKGKNNPAHLPHVKEIHRQRMLTLGENHPATLCWNVINPQGKIFSIRNLRMFCRKNNLNSGHLVEVAKGKRKQHKGWKCEYTGGGK